MKEIIIGDSTFKCKYIGDPIPEKISFADYNMKEDDVERYYEYQGALNRYDFYLKNKTESTKRFFSVIVSFLMVMLLAFSVLFHQNKDYIFDNLLFVIIIFLVMWRVVDFIVFCMLDINKFSLFFLNINKKRYPSPSPLLNENSIKKYIEDKINNEKEIYEYTKVYKNIKEFDNNILLYGESKLRELAQNVVSFIKIINEDIVKENNKKQQDWWYKLDPYQFEEEVAKWFRKKGFTAIVTSKSGDGGKDIILNKTNYTAYVQCKRYTTQKVDTPTLNALYGVVCADKIKEGIVVCLLGATLDAMNFAKKVGIKIYTIDDLAPNDLFNPVHKDNLLNEKVQKNNDYWIQIGSIYLNTCFYQKRDLAEQSMSKWGNIDYRVIEWSNLCWIIKSDESTFKNLSEYIYKIEHPVRNIDFDYRRKYKHKRNYKRRYW